MTRGNLRALALGLGVCNTPSEQAVMPEARTGPPIGAGFLRCGGVAMHRPRALIEADLRLASRAAVLIRESTLLPGDAVMRVEYEMAHERVNRLIGELDACLLEQQVSA